LIEVGPARVRLAVNKRARRLTLRFDTTRGEFTVVAPNARRLPEAADFARRRADWITERAGGALKPVPFTPGAVIPLRAGSSPCRP
jgi:predicted metal-dependent hydrolase